MTKQHPLTDEICKKIVEDNYIPHPGGVHVYPGEIACIRAAANWQLDRVLAWLDENLSNYTDDTYLGDCKSTTELPYDLEEAMCLITGGKFTNRFDHYSRLSDNACKRTQEILEEIQDDGGQPGSPTVYARELSKLLAYFEQRIDELEGKQETNS